MAEAALTLILTLTSADDISGTSIFSDGTKLYWSEGRDGYIVMLTGDNPIPVWLNVMTPGFDEEPHVKLLVDLPPHPMRGMTPPEERELHWARNLRMTARHEWKRK